VSVGDLATFQQIPERFLAKLFAWARAVLAIRIGSATQTL
jgi:hypothetical protein